MGSPCNGTSTGMRTAGRYRRSLMAAALIPNWRPCSRPPAPHRGKRGRSPLRCSPSPGANPWGSGDRRPRPPAPSPTPQPCACSPWVVRCRNRRARSRPSSLARSGSAPLVRLPRCRSASSPAGVRIQQFQHSPSPRRSPRWRRSGCSFAPQLEQHGTASPALRRARRRAWRSAGVSAIQALSRCPAIVAAVALPNGSALTVAQEPMDC
jgi:hypothetical protein